MAVSNSTDPAELMTDDELASPADIFVSRRPGSKRGGLGYYRFATAAEAIDFATANFAGLRPNDVVMAVEDKRFDYSALKALGRNAKRTSAKSHHPATRL